MNNGAEGNHSDKEDNEYLNTQYLLLHIFDALCRASILAKQFFGLRFFFDLSLRCYMIGLFQDFYLNSGVKKILT